VRPGIALAGETYALAVASPGLHPDLERLRALHQALAMTRGAHALRLTRAAAARARGVEFHPAAGLRDLTFTAALGTGFPRPDHPFAPAIAAGIQTGDVELHHRAADRVPEADIDLILQVSAVLRLALRSCTRAAPEDARENVPKPSAALPASA